MVSLTMQETILSIIEWHGQTFPQATKESQIAKYREELGEFMEATGAHRTEELADMFISAVGLMRFDLFEGITRLTDVLYCKRPWACIGEKKLCQAIDNKMRINRLRVFKGDHHIE